MITAAQSYASSEAEVGGHLALQGIDVLLVGRGVLVGASESVDLMYQIPSNYGSIVYQILNTGILALNCGSIVYTGSCRICIISTVF